MSLTVSQNPPAPVHTEGLDALAAALLSAITDPAGAKARLDEFKAAQQAASEATASAQRATDESLRIGRLIDDRQKDADAREARLDAREQELSAVAVQQAERVQALQEITGRHIKEAEDHAAAVAALDESRKAAEAELKAQARDLEAQAAKTTNELKAQAADLDRRERALATQEADLKRRVEALDKAEGDYQKRMDALRNLVK